MRVADFTAPASTPHLAMTLSYSPLLMIASSAALMASRSCFWSLETATPYGAASTWSPTSWKSLPPPAVLTAYAATGKSEELAVRAAGAQTGLRLLVVVEGLDAELLAGRALLGLRLGEVVGDGAALHDDLLAAEVVPGLDALGLALRGVDRDARVEVVDEVDAVADLLAGVGVDAVLTVLGVGHGRHGDVVAVRLQARDQGVERGVLELELHAELLAHGLREVGVDTDRLAGLVLELDGRVRDVRADPDDALVADLLRELVRERRGRGAGLGAVVGLRLVSAAGQQQSAG